MGDVYRLGGRQAKGLGQSELGNEEYGAMKISDLTLVLQIISFVMFEF